MDVSFNNVLEGTRQYFMGVPKAQEGSGQSMWPTGAPPEEGTPAMSGAPAPSSRPPSAAAAPPSTPTPTPVVMPPRPPSEPLEPEPHFIHKATVMREAAEKRRGEQPEPEDEEECAISPPSHIIRKPTPHMLPSPAPAPAAPSPSPARPPSAAPLQPLAPESLETSQYRVPVHRGQTPTIRPVEEFASGRPPDPYPTSRSADPFPRYQYETSVADSSRNSHGALVPSPQPSTILRQSPQTYARMSSSMSQHTVQRLNDASTSSSPVHRYPVQVQAPPLHNDRVPPIYHPQALPPSKRITSSSPYGTLPLPHRREPSTVMPRTSHFDRHPSLPQRKYDPQYTYSGYRPSSTSLPHKANHRIEPLQPLPYKHSTPDAINSHYAMRSSDRPAVPMLPHPHESVRISSRVDYASKNGPLDSRNSYHYPTPSTSSARYHPTAPVPVVQNNALMPSRTPYRTAVAPKTNYAYSPTNQIQTSPSRSTVKPGLPNQQTRMTVSVTSLVNEMNQTKQKRESPLDLSVKTVKNSADSSTTQDDAIDSLSFESKSVPLQARVNNRYVTNERYVTSHKVDFAPDFAQYRERSRLAVSQQQTHGSVQYNGAFETPRIVSENYSVESRQHAYPDRGKYSGSMNRNDYVHRIDLTRSVNEDRLVDNRMREEVKNGERKRIAGPIVSNIPEKIIRREAWPADSRGERLTQSAREQRDLMSRPVYDYTSHKRFESYQHDIKQPVHVYHDNHVNVNPAYSRSPYPVESKEGKDYYAHYQDRHVTNRHIIQKIPSREPHSQHFAPSVSSPFQHADKKVLSILRNSLETRQSANLDNSKSATSVPDLIVIDDVDDSVIEITDLTKDNENETGNKNQTKVVVQTKPSLDNHIQMPKAVDSISCDSEYQRFDNFDAKSKSPENDVASRIRTKAELKVMPPSQDTAKFEPMPTIKINNHEKEKILPKSQKQHLFNQIREDNLRLESVIKSENINEVNSMPEVKSEPMNIEEIEKDAVMSIKVEHNEDIVENSESKNPMPSDELDIDWATACDSFVEQLKSSCHKKKSRKNDIEDTENDNNNVKETENTTENNINDGIPLAITIKQEPVEEDEAKPLIIPSQEASNKCIEELNVTQVKNERKTDKNCEKTKKNKSQTKIKLKSKSESVTSTISTKKDEGKIVPLKTVIKEESESTDDDEPLIKSKILKEKERSEKLKYQLLKDLSEKSAIVKLECCDASTRKSLDSSNKERSGKQMKSKGTRTSLRSKIKTMSVENMKTEVIKDNSSSDSEEDSLSSRLRTRKNLRNEDRSSGSTKTPVKSSPSKKGESSSASNSSTPLRKPGFGDGSDFHPGWEEELYRYKRSLRMPTRLIAIPRGRSGGPFVKGSNVHFNRGSTSLPDLDPMPLSPAPSSAPSVATDELYRRPEKITLDSDLESNSSYSAPHRLHYDSEASTSTVLSSTKTRKSKSSIVDVLIQRCGKKEGSKKRSKDKEDRTPKILPKSSNIAELLPTPSLGLLKNGHKGNLSGKKEKVLEDIFYLGAFRKETVTAFRDAFIKDTDGLIGATEEFAPLMLKSRTRTESRVLKQRATIKEVFGDDRPASAPPTSCRDECNDDEPILEIKKENEPKPKIKSKSIKDKLKRRSSSIRDGLRSTKSLKRNDAKGRMMRLKKRNSLMKTLSGKRMKEVTNKQKKDKNPIPDEKQTIKEENTSIDNPEGTTKRRFKRLFGRRKLSSGFDYIRKKKKVIRKEENVHKVRRPAPKPSPESVHDIQKEIKGWFINKSIGETHLHRAARLGFTDCVAYCLEKMEADPSAKDNAGFTALHVASAKGHVRIARLLLQYGANISAAAQGGIRPLHEACENSHVEVIRLLLSYGADPLLGTYAGQTPENLAEGPAAQLLHLHIDDVQGRSVEPWRFPPPNEILDREEIGCDPLSSPPPSSPPPPPDSTIEIQCTETPLPPFYSLRTANGQPADGLWCLLQDVTNILQIKSKESLLKQIHCGSGSPKELLREIRTQEFLERAQCHQLLCAGEKVNVRASKVALIRVTDKLRQLLKIETILVS